MADGEILSRMTSDELSKLFPIIICEHDPSWAEKYKEEECHIISAVGKDCIERISHIGSTAVPHLMAKPTIDILLEVKKDTDLTELKSKLLSIGYLLSEQPDKPAPHMMFMKGYTAKGFEGQTFHVHIRYLGYWDELIFRDYLRRNKEVAKQYGTLKTDLEKQYKYDRDGYTKAKTVFINNIMNICRQ